MYIDVFNSIISIRRAERSVHGASAEPVFGCWPFRNTGSRPVASSAAGWRVNAGESGRMCAEAYARSADVYMHAAKHRDGTAPPADWAGRPLRSFAPLSVRMYMWSIVRDSAVTNRIGGRLYRMHELS